MEIEIDYIHIFKSAIANWECFHNTGLDQLCSGCIEAINELKRHTSDTLE